LITFLYCKTVRQQSACSVKERVDGCWMRLSVGGRNGAKSPLLLLHHTLYCLNGLLELLTYCTLPHTDNKFTPSSTCTFVLMLRLQVLRRFAVQLVQEVHNTLPRQALQICCERTAVVYVKSTANRTSSLSRRETDSPRPQINPVCFQCSENG